MDKISSILPPNTGDSPNNICMPCCMHQSRRKSWDEIPQILMEPSGDREIIYTRVKELCTKL